LKQSANPWIEIAAEVAAFSLLTASIVLLWRDNLLLLAVLLVEASATLRLWHDRVDVSSFVVLGSAGLFAEVVFVHFGVWHYANPTLLGVPLWFPVAFGTAGLIGQRLARTSAEIWDRITIPQRRKG